MTNRYAALNENMIYYCPHDVVPLYEKRLYSAFQFMHQLPRAVSQAAKDKTLSDKCAQAHKTLKIGLNSHMQGSFCGEISVNQAKADI